MQLSIVIVNYNVKYFVEQCLLSVLAASKNIATEIFVVDNHSSDDSVAYLQARFPSVIFIANKENVGFSKANNQAIAQAKGEYVLILNPDTVVAEDTFEKCIGFMQKTPDAGALGVKMIDGKGVFLPESKRALPTPAVAFYKIFGLASIFPTSKQFGRYHLGFLSKDETNPVEILSGAFMFFRKKVLDTIGYFDEQFFMYGEDIDLSYRVILGGYKNYYFAETTIIHYKGESTKKGSLNYVKVFYQAMLIFAKKHFVSNKASLFSLLINIAVVFRALVTLVVHVLSSSFLVFIDAFLAYVALFFITNYWAQNIKHEDAYYPIAFLVVVIPFYIVMWIASVFFTEGYEKPYRIFPVLKGVFVSTILIAAIYGFLPETWRFSRAIILFGSFSIAAIMLLSRLVHNFLKHQQFSFEETDKDALLLVANPQNAHKIESLLLNVKNDFEIVATKEKIAPNELKHITAIYQPTEIIFSAAEISYKKIIELIETLSLKFDYKIFNTSMDVLIGSNSKNTAGDIYVVDKKIRLSKPIIQTKKRVLDFFVSLAIILFLPFFVMLKRGLLLSAFEVLFNKKTWVGYIQNDSQKISLPRLKSAVYEIVNQQEVAYLQPEEILFLNKKYAKEYTLFTDVKIIAKEIFEKKA